jgi:hypothetical protein
MHDIYQAAESGHLDQAQTMIGQVLADHPDSAKAHYVAAEIDARQGRIAGAREQMATAERLAPGLPFAKPESVAALRAQLGTGGNVVRSVSPAYAAGSAEAQAAPHFSWTPVVIVALCVGLFMMWRSNRRTAAAYPAPAAPGAGYGPAPAPGGGLGSSVAGGLAGGLAAGAGLVAGEALMHRFLDGGNGERAGGFAGDNANLGDPRGNADMGGEDFGIADNSWNDSSGGGGDDWS